MIALVLLLHCARIDDFLSFFHGLSLFPLLTLLLFVALALLSSSPLYSPVFTLKTEGKGSLMTIRLYGFHFFFNRKTPNQQQPFDCQQKFCIFCCFCRCWRLNHCFILFCYFSISRFFSLWQSRDCGNHTLTACILLSGYLYSKIDRIPQLTHLCRIYFSFSHLFHFYFPSLSVRSLTNPKWNYVFVLKSAKFFQVNVN